jgi:pimeloyl-ACP methyl ester carboxylesterase
MRMMGRLAMAAFVGLLLASPALWAAPALAGEPIHEESFVRIGGIDQWITVTGQDRDNPVLLLLHGGPGVTFTPNAEAMFQGWDKDFTLVEWDQRGAGRTFTRNGGEAIAPTMSLDRMVQDGIEVARYAADHLSKKKVILLGASWGSILGVHMIHQRPDLFSAYVGPDQIVNAQKNAALVYARVLAMAKTAKDDASVAALEKIGPPVEWKSLADFLAYNTVEQTYQQQLAPRPADPPVSPAYAAPEERGARAKAIGFSTQLFFGDHMEGPLAHTDLPALGMTVKVPVFVIQGEHDMTALPELARAFVADLNAPRKGFYLLPGAGHAPGPELWALTHKVLLEEVRPLARE